MDIYELGSQIKNGDENTLPFLQKGNISIFGNILF